ARFGVIDRSVERSPCARRCRRTDARNAAVGSSPAGEPNRTGTPARLGDSRSFTAERANEGYPSSERNPERCDSCASVRTPVTRSGQQRAAVLLRPARLRGRLPPSDDPRRAPRPRRAKRRLARRPASAVSDVLCPLADTVSEFTVARQTAILKGNTPHVARPEVPPCP